MSNKPNKGKFQPKASGKKKKKKKKKKKSTNEPFLDPHFTEANTHQQALKPKQKRQRKTKFEIDVEAPTIQISGDYNRNRNRNNAPNTAHIPRRPRNKRTAVSKVVFGATNKMNKINDLEMAERKVVRTVKFSPEILEDNSGDEHDEEEEKKDIMDIDNDVEDDNYDYDPWMNKDNNGNGDDEVKYTPITLKRKPNYGKNGTFVDNDLENVFKEKEQFGNEFIFMQMPPVLPLVSHLNEDEQNDLKKGRNVKESLLRQMGEGNVGKIRIRKSGKIELVIGEYVMDVGFSSPIDCFQQVMYIHCEHTSDSSVKGKSQFLGNVPPQNNLVCSYRAEDLLQ
eukprot:385417_1